MIDADGALALSRIESVIARAADHIVVRAALTPHLIAVVARPDPIVEVIADECSAGDAVLNGIDIPKCGIADLNVTLDGRFKDQHGIGHLDAFAHVDKGDGIFKCTIRHTISGIDIVEPDAGICDITETSDTVKPKFDPFIEIGEDEIAVGVSMQEKIIGFCSSIIVRSDVLKDNVIDLVGIEIHDGRVQNASPKVISASVIASVLSVVDSEDECIIALTAVHGNVCDVLMPRVGVDIDNVMSVAAVDGLITPQRKDDIIAVAAHAHAHVCADLESIIAVGANGCRAEPPCLKGIVFTGRALDQFVVVYR